MAKDFADLQDAARKLADIVTVKPDLIISIQPNGALIAQMVATKFGCRLTAANIDRANINDPESVELDLSNLESSIEVLVIDDAVETGQAAMAVGIALRTRGFTNLSLAVPICPRESAYQLGQVYSRIDSLVRPMARRSLTWHYDVTPSTTEDDAQAIIDAYNKEYEQTR